MRISDWSSDVCSSDLVRSARLQRWRLAFLLRALLHDPQRRHLSVLVFAPVYGAVRVGNLDAALVEDLLDNLVVGTPCRPLAAGQGLDATPHHHRRVTAGGDALHLETAQTPPAVLGVAKLTERIEQNRNTS